MAFQDGISHTDPKDLLNAFKTLAVTTVHPALHVVSLHETKQLSEESVKAFCARVKGIARNCNLEKLCTKALCNESVSFVEETCFHVVLTGLLDQDIKEKVLTQAMVGNVKDLPTLVEYVSAEESARQKAPPRNVAAMSGKDVPQKQSDRKCSGCGLSQHGSFNKNRAKQCKAYGKACAKCSRNNHFATVCRSNNPTTKAIEAEATVEEVETSVNGFVTGIMVSALTSPASVAPEIKSLREKVRSNVNSIPIPHHIYDKEIKSWRKRGPKPSPTIEVSLTVDRQAYKDLKLNIPDLVKKQGAGHARARRGTLDSGAQLTVMKEIELQALGIKKNSIFPVALTVNTVTKSTIDLIGGIFVIFSAFDREKNERRISRQLCYISRSVTGIYLSEEACIDLGYIQSNSEVGSGNPVAALSSHVIPVAAPSLDGNPVAALSSHVIPVVAPSLDGIPVAAQLPNGISIVPPSPKELPSTYQELDAMVTYLRQTQGGPITTLPLPHYVHDAITGWNLTKPRPSPTLEAQFTLDRQAYGKLTLHYPSQDLLLGLTQEGPCQPLQCVIQVHNLRSYQECSSQRCR